MASKTGVEHTQNGSVLGTTWGHPEQGRGKPARSTPLSARRVALASVYCNKKGPCMCSLEHTQERGQMTKTKAIYPEGRVSVCITAVTDMAAVYLLVLFLGSSVFCVISNTRRTPEEPRRTPEEHQRYPEEKPPPCPLLPLPLYKPIRQVTSSRIAR